MPWPKCWKIHFRRNQLRRDVREYERRARWMKQIFTDHGFSIVYDKDVTQQVGDGFFFTLGYPGLTGGELLRELMMYGVSSISLSTTGSEQQGVRACTSRMREELIRYWRNV